MSPSTAPKSVAVVGGGMVGLATAWHLQEYGCHVTVFDRGDLGAGASWGNAGWLTPGIAAPLPEPAVLRYGIRSLVSPTSPLYVPLRLRPELLRFLLEFARNSTAVRWRSAMQALLPLNALALDAFDEFERDGFAARTRPADVLAAYRTSAERQALVTEIEHIRDAGQAVEFELLDGDEARAAEPLLSLEVGAALRLRGQRFLDPGHYVATLGKDVAARGAQISAHTTVDQIDIKGSQVVLAGTSYDAAVLATGARLGELARRHGVKTPVQAGRGYSFSIEVDSLPSRPVYLPTQRIACTPIGGRLRVGGMMEFRRPSDPLDPRRIAAIAHSAAPLLQGAHLDDRRNEWVGSRPCTPDGLPLIGRTREPRLYVAGGHGMWGMTLGPITGKLLAAHIATGRSIPELRPFDPTR